MADVSVTKLTDLPRAGITKRVQFVTGGAVTIADVLQGSKLGITTVKRVLMDVTGSFNVGANSNHPAATAAVADGAVLIVEGV